VLDLLCNVAATAIDALQSRAAHDNAQDSIVFALATLAEHRDVETGAHLHRVTQYASMLAEDLRARGQFLDVIDDEFMRALRRAMPLHDIGKVGIPDSILLKPGVLTDGEIVQMRRHAEIGGRTIRSVRERTPGADFLLVAEQIAWGHHERWDGTGYPAGLATLSIPLSARLAAVADVYDALTTDRVYRRAVSHEEAARAIRDGAGTQFDPTIVEAFLACEGQLAQIAVEA
jgi:putative two-component system response regulator